MNFLMNDSIITAVSWTLIHSLWLGLAVALLAALTVFLTKKSPAAMRYNLLAGLTVLFLVTVGFIFYHELDTPETVFTAEKTVTSDFKSTALVPLSGIATKAAPVTPLSMMKAFMGQYGAWIVFAWFLVFVYKCLRMTVDFRQVYRAKNYQTVAPPEIWQQRVLELQTLLRIKRGVQLLESKLVTIPSVAGVFKPVILVPVGLFNNIPHDQVEAILLHELAHIRRSDYLVNLLQTFVEILFFFNPGILWVSSLVKDERENCCDDLAISITNNKKEFVNALVSFQEYSLNLQPLALQFGHQKMKLADRAKRILFNSNKMISTTEKYFLSAGIAVTVILFLIVAKVNHSAAQEIVKTPAMHADEKEIPDGTSMKYLDVVNGKKIYTYLFKSGGTLYQVPESLEQIKVNGKLISDNEKAQYLPKINQLIGAYEWSVASHETDPFSGIESPDLSEEERIIDEASRQIDVHSAIIDKHSAIIDQHSAIIDQQALILEAEANKKDGQINWKKHDEAQRRIQEAQTKIQAESDKINQESLKINDQSRKIEEQSRRIAAKLKVQQEEMRRVEAELQSNQDKERAEMSEPIREDITEAVIRDLKKAGYKGKVHSFELNEKSLFINGKVQSAELFEKVKKHIKPGMRIVYNIEVN